MEWIIQRHHALSEVESKIFKKFIRIIAYAPPSLYEAMPQSVFIIRSSIIERFNQQKTQVKTRIADSKSIVHILFDL